MMANITRSNFSRLIVLSLSGHLQLASMLGQSVRGHAAAIRA
ncbi:hypothetical protein [Paenibacillus agricola]|nr:hypothetical protein [Paenibacillus agricola]